MIFTYLFRQVRLYDKGAYIKPSVDNCPQLCLEQLLILGLWVDMKTAV